eukprot:745868-Hanusia_phi.AAC.3
MRCGEDEKVCQVETCVQTVQERVLGITLQYMLHHLPAVRQAAVQVDGTSATCVCELDPSDCEQVVAQGEPEDVQPVGLHAAGKGWQTKRRR